MQFIFQLENVGLTDEKGIYKAVGHIRNNEVKGIKIGSYWDGFEGSRKKWHCLSLLGSYR